MVTLGEFDLETAGSGPARLAEHNIMSCLVTSISMDFNWKMLKLGKKIANFLSNPTIFPLKPIEMEIAKQDLVGPASAFAVFAHKLSGYYHYLNKSYFNF